MKRYRGTQQSAQRIVDHIIHFRKTKAVPILGILNAAAEQRKQHRDEKPLPSPAPAPGEQFESEQAGREEQYRIHIIGAVDFPVSSVEGGMIGGEGGQNGLAHAGTFGALTECAMENHSDPQEKQKDDSGFPIGAVPIFPAQKEKADSSQQAQ